MLKKILLALVVLVALAVGFVAMQPSAFRIARTVGSPSAIIVKHGSRGESAMGADRT